MWWSERFPPRMSNQHAPLQARRHSHLVQIPHVPGHAVRRSAAGPASAALVPGDDASYVGGHIGDRIEGGRDAGCSMGEEDRGRPVAGRSH